MVISDSLRGMSVTLVEVAGLNGDKILVSARSVSLIRPGLTADGATGTTRIELGKDFYHTKVAMVAVTEAFSKAGGDFIELTDADGNLFFASTAAIASIESANKGDPPAARTALSIAGKRQAVRQSIEDVAALFSKRSDGEEATTRIADS